MERRIFNYKVMTVDAEGNKTLMSNGGIFIDCIINYIKKDDSLYLFLSKDNESVQLVEAPQKRKPTKTNPNEWERGVEKRVVTEPIAIQITEAEDVARWEAYVESVDI